MAAHSPPHPVDERSAVERKLSHARAQLFSRIDELGRRVTKARNAVDVAQIIRDHPLVAVGVAMSAGVLLGLPRGKGKVRTELSALIMAIAAGAVRTTVTSWVLDHIRGPSTEPTWTAPAH